MAEILDLSTGFKIIMINTLMIPIEKVENMGKHIGNVSRDGHDKKESKEYARNQQYYKK